MNDEKRLDEILEELRKPFHPSRITWKPGSVTEDGSKALALAYADLRAYQNRLDEVCGMDWSVSYTPWGERIVCHLTIHGITRSSTGEPDMESERSEIAGTAAEAQAFKRACSMFGLGRYLYTLPMVWADYDAEHNRFTEQAKARLTDIVTQHYQRALSGEDEAPVPLRTTDFSGTTNGTQNGAHQNGVHRNGAQKSATQKSAAQKKSAPPKNAAEKDAAQPSDDKASDALVALHERFNVLGQEMYGEQWERVRAHNVQRISSGDAQTSSALSLEQIQKLINGMEKLKRQREVAA